MSDGSEARANILYQLISQEEIDGLVTFSSTVGWFIGKEKLVDFCKGYEPLPVVSVDVKLAGIPSVVKSNYQGMREAMIHLIEEHGYRRIAFLCGPENADWAQERLRAYTETLTDYGLDVDEKLIAPAPTTWEFARPEIGPATQQINILLNERNLVPGIDFEALVGATDSLIQEAVRTLQERGVQIPEQVAVTGFDDEPTSSVITPPLTTIRAPFCEMGYKAVELVLALLAGEQVPEQVSLPCKLVIRQSCGCQDPCVAAVTATPGHTPAVVPLDAPLIQPELGAEMVRVAQASGIESIQHELEPILDTFTAELTGAQPGVFLNALDEALQRSTATVDELSQWHNIISTLWQHILLRLNHNGAEARQAETLLREAQVLIGRVAERTQMLKSLRDHQQELDFQRVSASLLATLDINALMDTLANELPGLGIPSCYLSLFENPRPYQYPDPAPQWARLVLAYGPQGRTPLESPGQRFPARQLIPDELWPQDRACSFVLLSLHFQQEQIGFVLFESGSRRGSMYETLRMEISSALQGTLLVQRVQERSAALARHQYILGTFMANVPDSIYFKDCQSRITLANPAHARDLGLHDSLEEIGKTDFDFFPEEQARPRYEQEQEIIRTGQPILALEEPCARGRWALTTKMPLRDERGEIIGTFGISRDITELKRMQATLEKANAEISTLNERLKAENLRMEAELDVTRRLQQMLLPTEEELLQIEGLDIAGFMQPADEVGGDYYDVLQHNGALKIGIGDVTGHGLESGVVMLMLQTAVRTLQTSGVEDPVYFMDILNRLLHANLQRMNVDKSMTLALLDYDAGRLAAPGHLRLSGQHEQLIVVRRGGKVELIDTIDLGFPLGIEDGIAHFVKEMPPVELKAGDGVVLYSDGITEAENEAKEFYGLERLCQVVSAHWDEPAESVKDAVVADVRGFIGQQKVYDDLTLLVAKQK
ncbi:MAG: substrate-binding domain-containing protein [Thermoflexales bacterium]|nr:substrate-binding domain-containing protein [Thermoflexales bacterium]